MLFRSAFLPPLSVAGLALLEPKWKDLAEAAALAVCAAAALWARPWKLLRAAERAAARFAARRRQAILLAALAPMLLRIALLPVLPVPEPLVADEFGYLLLADTFAAGRVANPPHPLWKHFESVYVLHEPSYASIYPVAPALLMALPQAAGAHPWLGVWLAAGVMCGLICWMLQAWAPPRWALWGGLLAGARFAVAGPWMNTYWGGAAAAIGGALALGAFARIVRLRRARDGILFALGLGVLAQSRPYEGLLMAAPLTLALAGWLVRERLRGRPVLRVAAPLGAVLLALAAGTAFYNHRVTGSALLMPYGLHQKVYGTPQSFFWQKPILDAPGIHRARDIADVFAWQLEAHRSQFTARAQAERLARFWRFYLQPLLTLPLLFLPFVMQDRRMLVLAASAAAVLIGNALYPFFFPHYAAALCPLLMLLVVEGARRMRALRFRSRPAGAAMFHAWLLLVAASAAATLAGSLLRPRDVAAHATPRARAVAELRQYGGKHLVLVSYSPEHSFHHGVVYNGADIDGSEVIWARALDAARNRALADRYPDRSVWLLNPDEEPLTLVPYSGKPYIRALTGGAGKRDDAREGVSPGGIAVVLGGNFARGVRGAAPARPVLGTLPVQPAGASFAFGDLFVPARAGAVPRIPAGPHDVAVRFNGVKARVLGLSRFDGRESVTVRVPEGLRPGPAEVTLEAAGQVARKQTRILPAAPGIFQMRMEDARPRAILRREDGSLVDLARPARRGETLRLFATGLGSAPQVVVGVNHGGAPLVNVAPSGLAGVHEVAFQVPAAAPSGRDVPLAIAAMADGKPVFGNKSSLPVE